MLTEHERSLIHRTFAQGPAILFEEGYDEAGVQEFLHRQDVRAAFAMLEREMDSQEALTLRSRYMTRRSISRLSQGAVAVLGQALAGPQYLMTEKEGVQVPVTDAKGQPILRRPEVTPTQMRAAENVMDALGIRYGAAKHNSAPGADVSVEILFKETDTDAVAEIQDDPEHTEAAQKALSRERVRTVIDLLAHKVPELHENVKRSVGITVEPAPPKKRTTKKKAVKKKASKKPAKKKTTRKTRGRTTQGSA